MKRNFRNASAAVCQLRLKPTLMATLLSALALAGCASFSPDHGMNIVATVAGETINKDVVSIRTTDDAEWARRAVESLLRRTLTVDTAVQIALLNNRGLQAAYNELALAEADLVEQSLPPNPTFCDFKDRRERLGRDRTWRCWSSGFCHSGGPA